MKFLNKLKINIDDFINKHELFNYKTIIRHLDVENLEIAFDDRTFFYYNVKWYNYNKMINDSNSNDFKKFIDYFYSKKNDNVLNFDIYYDFILNEYIKYLNKEKKIPLDSLKDYTLKSSKYCFDFIKYNEEEWKKIPQKQKEEIIKNILKNPEEAVKYATTILKDRLPEYENKLLNFKINDKEVTFYLKNVITKLISDQPSKEDKRMMITRFYKESELFKKALEYYVNNNNYKSFFNFYYWIEEVEDIVLKDENVLRNYLYNTYFSSDRDKREIFTNEIFQQFLKKINKSIIGVFVYYKNVLYSNLKNNPEAAKLLMSDPYFLMKFIAEVYERKKVTFEELEEIFPGYKKIVSKVDDLDIIEMFFYTISKILYQGQNVYSAKKHRKIYDEYKKYLYDNYSGLIKKISKDPNKSLQFALFIQAPFKEGEPSIFSNYESRFRYLSFIKDLGPDLVPDYDRYDFSELDVENEEGEEDVEYNYEDEY